MNLGQIVPDGDDAVTRRVRDLERELQAQRAARTLESSTIGEGGLTVRGGEIRVTDGAGNLLVTLGPDGVVPSSPLAYPVYPQVHNNTQSLGSMSTGTQDYGSVTVTRPAGFTRALVMMTASIGIRGGNSFGTSFSVQARAGSALGASISGQAATSGIGNATSALAWTGNVAATFTLAVRVDVQNGGGVAGANVQLAASVLFLR